VGVWDLRINASFRRFSIPDLGEAPLDRLRAVFRAAELSVRMYNLPDPSEMARSRARVRPSLSPSVTLARWPRNAPDDWLSWENMLEAT